MWACGSVQRLWVQSPVLSKKKKKLLGAKCNSLLYSKEYRVHPIL